MTVELVIPPIPNLFDENRDAKEHAIAETLLKKIRALLNSHTINKIGITVRVKKDERDEILKTRKESTTDFVELKLKPKRILMKMHELMRPLLIRGKKGFTDPPYSELAGLVEFVPIHMGLYRTSVDEDLDYIKNFAHSDDKHLIVWGFNGSDPYGVGQSHFAAKIREELDTLIQWNAYDMAFEKLSAIASRKESIPQLAGTLLSNVADLREHGNLQDADNRNTITRIMTLTSKILHKEASDEEFNEYIQLADQVDGKPSGKWKAISAGMVLIGLTIIAFGLISSFATWGGATLLFGSKFLGHSSIYCTTPAGFTIGAGIICFFEFGRRRGLSKAMMDVSNHTDDPDDSDSSAEDSARGTLLGSPS